MSDSFGFKVRPERFADAAQVRLVLEAAFGQAAEADLVERLRADGDIALALVAGQPDGAIVGYVAFCRLTLETSADSVPVLGLAPLAVAPAMQRRGIGDALVRAGLRMLTAAGETHCFVLGDPAYYRRFGFDPAAARPFKSAYAGPHFMLHRMAASAAPHEGSVGYPAAFDAPG